MTNQLRQLSYILLLILNLLSLYLIIDLSNYDEMVSYLKNGGEKLSNPRETAMVFFFTCVTNLLFVCIVWMKSFIFSSKVKTSIHHP